MEAPLTLNALKGFRTKEASEFSDMIHMVGMRHQREAEFLKFKKTGTTVIMIPEPANKHDPNAIACYVTKPTDEGANYTWVLAGYISRSQTILLKDRGAVYEGSIYRKAHDYWSVTAELFRVF